MVKAFRKKIHWSSSIPKGYVNCVELWLYKPCDVEIFWQISLFHNYRINKEKNCKNWSKTENQYQEGIFKRIKFLNLIIAASLTIPAVHLWFQIIKIAKYILYEFYNLE